MTTEQRAFPPFRVPGGVAIARRRHFPKYLDWPAAGLPERDPDSDNHSDDDPIGAVILVTLPDRTPQFEGSVKAFVFTIFGDNFDEQSGDGFKVLFLASETGQKLYAHYAAACAKVEEDVPEFHDFVEDYVEFTKFLYKKTSRKITLVHEYFIGD